MTGASAQASDVAMKGGGYYSLSTTGAKDVIDAAIPLALEAIEAMPIAGARPFVLADMGCADGGTSVDLVRAALEAVRAKRPELPLWVVYSDQPRNDYNALFQILNGGTEIRSYLDDFEGLSVTASATSFYRQVLPQGALDLGFSATAMHWLSAKPCDISDHVQAVGARGAELEAFAEQGRRDWETILLHRAAELAPGGAFVMANFCKDEEGRYLGHTGGVDMFDCFNRLWQALRDERRISAEEYRRMTLPQYYKTVEEFSAPLTDPGNAVHRAGLRLHGIETRVTPCPYAADFRRHGDADAFARAYVPTLRSWTESTFFGALAPERPLAERREIIDSYYDRYEAMVRERPEGHAMDYVHAFMSVRKI
ncbi:MAG: class I SAM-dependent methyltransferase [Kiloniellales bacterium]|nr:class I SAM-dependent methyltransferase [Kiloniellales bacterium]